MSPCDNLISFVDGELDAIDSEAFREHLRTCEACPTNLIEAAQLSAHLSTLPIPIRRPVKRRAKDATRGSSAGATVGARLAAVGWRRATGWGTGLAAAIVAVVAGWHLVASPPGKSTPNEATLVAVIAGLESRPYEIHLAYPGAMTHRPARDAMLGSGASPEGEVIPADLVAKLKQAGDKHGVAIAGLWNGARPSDVERRLSAIEQTEPVRSDRAAMAVLTTDAANVEPVLAELELLQRSRDGTVARAARWNHALLLARLGLPLAAAQAFRAIADDHEPGWAEDAARRAAQQSRLGDDLAASWRQACQAGEALVRDGTPIPPAMVGAFPGVLRTYFYNAVRTAPSVERVQALAPLAAELDRLGDPGQHTLTDHVRRVAKLGFARRAPLAAAYAALLRGDAMPAALAAQLTKETDADDLADIVMGAMIERDIIADHRAWFHRRVNRDNDPWFQVVLSRVEADVEAANGRWLGARTILQDAEKLCTPALRYQCLQLDRHLGWLDAELQRIPESLTLLRRAVVTARAAREWGRYHNLLMELADVERFHGATATVRAYTDELLQMTTDCDDRYLIYRRLAGAAILDADGGAARGYLDQAMALRCARTDQSVATYFSDIATLDPRPDDLARMQRMLATLRTASKLTAGGQALTAALEGRVAIATERDRVGGVALLEKAIATADAAPGDMIAQKARAAAYNMLVFDAAHRDDSSGALDLVARDLQRSPPRDCAVAMAAEGKHAAIVVRRADGADRGRYLVERPRRGALSVPSDLAGGLAGCQRVGVMAPAALQGQPGVLPAELPWSYTARVPDRATPSDPSPGDRRTLIVTNVTPPPDLELAPLSTEPPDDVSATTLSGDAATPARVLAAMVDATEVEFHTHALLDVGVSDASHLVLSPEAPRAPYALTAEAIRSIRLRRRPIVVLEACHSAVGARYEHAPWSLPDAFLTAGARAVFAAATEIPDVASGQFFARVLARVRGGAQPAAALRDERIATLHDDPNNKWVASVILFE